MKGQVNMEFMMFIGLILVILLIATYVAATTTSGVVADNQVTDARKIARAVGGEINLAVEIGDGYKHNFYLPERMYNGQNYSVNFTESGFVYVLWKNSSYSLPVLAANITGAAKKGKNVIKNIGGVISFE